MQKQAPTEETTNAVAAAQSSGASDGETGATPKKKRGFNPKDFVKPKPSRLVMGIMGPVNKCLILNGVPFIRRLPIIWNLPIIRDIPSPGSTAKVKSIDFPQSEIEKFKQYINENTAAFIGPNHPEFWTDWSLDKVFSNAVSPRMAHWAWYGTVNASPFMQAFWLRNNLISNAPNGKEEAKQHAIDWVKQGYGNLLHTEGTVNWTADKIQPIFGGIIDMSIRTSQDLIAANDPRPVYAVPMLSKYYFIEDVSAALAREIGQIEAKLGFESKHGMSLEDRFFALQKNILCQKLAEFESTSADVEVTPRNFFQIQEQFQEELLNRLKEIYGEREGILSQQLRSYEKEIKKNRVREERDTRLKKLCRGPLNLVGIEIKRPKRLTDEQQAGKQRYKAEAKLVAEIRRLDTFKPDVYGNDKLTQEQIAETLKRTKRDLVNFTTMDGIRNLTPAAAGWRKVILRCGEPIDVRARVEAHTGPIEELKEELVDEFRTRMQKKLDEVVAMTKPATDQFTRANPFALARCKS